MQKLIELLPFIYPFNIDLQTTHQLIKKVKILKLHLSIINGYEQSNKKSLKPLYKKKPL